MSSNNTSTISSIESCFMTYIVITPSESYVINSALGCIVNVILAFAGTFLNALVVCVFWKTPNLWHKVSYFTIMVLSCIDMAVGIIVHPLHLVNSIAEMTATSMCFYKMFYQTSAVILSGMSYFTLFVMNVERYISIVHPFFHRKHVTKRGCLLFASALWIVCLVVGIAPIFKIDIQFIVSVLALLVLAATFFIYVSIFHVARISKFKRTSKRTKSFDNVTEDSTATVADKKTAPSTPDSRTKSEMQHDSVQADTSETKEASTAAATEMEAVPHTSKTVSFIHDLVLAKMYLLVVFSSILLNLPNAVVLAMFPERITHLDGIVQAKIWTLTLVAANSTVNSLIFFWANNRLRNEALKICKRIFNR